jgi:hypothetical protein
MKHVIYAAALLALTATAALADQFDGIYGNTVTITRPDGSKSTVYVNADKTWEQRTADGKVYKGTWVWKDDTHACFTQVEPASTKPDDATSCDEITGNHKAGDTWTESDDKGHTTTIAITAGRS